MCVESDRVGKDINQKYFGILKQDGDVRDRIFELLKKHCQTVAPESHDICIVAHSEGTVVSYFSLVQAALERESDPGLHPWLPRVSGFVTMGSPLDKHYTIWKNPFFKRTLNKA